MDLTIITSLFNRLDLTRPYLESLERTLADRWKYEVILVDDGSTDGTRDFLATLPAERYRVILNDAPRGFAANNNAAARLARCELLCLLNNDVVLLPGWLKPMARLARIDPEAGVVGNVQREPVSGLVDHFGIWFRAPDTHPLHAGKNRPLAPREPYLAWPAVTAACWVVRRTWFDAMGGFDEGFRNGFEDVDFCLRTGARGYRHYVANRSVIYHHVSASPGRRQHEDANEARFHARWDGRAPLGMPPFVMVDDLRRDGSRYLRKHRFRPWKYNAGRLGHALKQRFTPWPPDSRPPWPVRGLLGILSQRQPSAEVLTPLPGLGPGNAGSRGLRPGLSSTAPAGAAEKQHFQPSRPGQEQFQPPLPGPVEQARPATPSLGRGSGPDRSFRRTALDGDETAVLPPRPTAGYAAASVFLVMEDTVQNPGRSGIQTVVRSLAGALGRAGAPVRMVVWDAATETLRLLPPEYSAGLAAEPLRVPDAPPQALHDLPPPLAPPPGAWVLMPELMYRPRSAQMLAYVHRHGWRLALIFHDAIPVTHPGVVPPALPALHAGYMEDFSRAHLVLPVSEASARDWRAFAAERGLPLPRVIACPLASDVAGVARVLPADIAPPTGATASGGTVRMLCVSTLEPRKNHVVLLDAYERASARLPDCRLELHLVGAPYVGAPEIAEDVSRFVKRHSGRVTWHAQIEYSLLRRLYEATDFTVYPSVLEGFGLPIIESLWLGRPCVCANFGVMAENAVGGGCVTVDVRNPETLAEAIVGLASSPERRYALALEAARRPLRTWDEYAAAILAYLKAER